MSSASEIIFSTCFHGRAALSEQWIQHTMPLGTIVAAVSDAENLELVRRYGIEHVWTNNRPLGAKHNAAMALARGRGCPVMILPSDDFVHPEYVASALASGADYVFPASCGIYDQATGRAVVMRWDGGDGLVYGAGRVVSSRLLDVVGELWTPSRMKGLDTDSHCTIISKGFRAVAVDVGHGVCLTDVKSGTNLWGFDQVAARGSSCPPELVLSHFGSM